jgi:hypothetical protein
MIKHVNSGVGGFGLKKNVLPTIPMTNSVPWPLYNAPFSKIISADEYKAGQSFGWIYCLLKPSQLERFKEAYYYYDHQEWTL